MLPLINQTPSDLTFASCQRISEAISHHIIPPTYKSRQPSLSPFSSQHSHSASLPPLSAPILASPQRPHSLLHAPPPTHTHKPLHLPLPTRRFTAPVLSAFPRSPVLPSPCERSHQQRCLPRVRDILQSLELRNSKVAARNKLGERQQDGDSSVFTLASHGSKWKHILRVFPPWGIPDPPAPPPRRPAAFRFHMCSLVSSDLHILKQAFTAVPLTKVPGDIFKFSLCCITETFLGTFFFFFLNIHELFSFTFSVLKQLLSVVSCGASSDLLSDERHWFVIKWIITTSVVFMLSYPSLSNPLMVKHHTVTQS